MKPGSQLHVNDQLQCTELHLGMDEQQHESLWVRIKGGAGIGDIIVGVWGSHPTAVWADEALYR